jgi:hypothetical protein
MMDSTNGSGTRPSEVKRNACFYRIVNLQHIVFHDHYLLEWLDYLNDDPCCLDIVVECASDGFCLIVFG